VTTNSYKSRTTLWDDEVSAEPSAPAPNARGAWRAPSVPTGRGTLSGVSPIPAGLEDDDPIPKRRNSYGKTNSWWRPRNNFGRIVLGSTALIVTAVLVTTGIIVHKFLTHDAHFRILGASSIQSTGLSEVNRADLLPVFGEDIGRNIFFVPLRDRRKQLEEIPWVKQATVMRFLPDRLSVSIIERTPVAFVRQGQQVELADADGVILSMPPAMMAQHHYSFPVVTGINPQDAPSARKARMAVYQRFIAELDQNQQHLSEQVSEIDLSDPEDLRATMPEQGTDILAHFGEAEFLHRLQIYKAHIAEWRQRYPKLIGVDLRYDGDVPLEMATPEKSDKPGATVTVPTNSTPSAKGAEPKEKTAKAPDAKVPEAKPVAKPVAKSTATTEKKKPKVAAPTATQKKAVEAKKKAAKLKAAKALAARQKAAHSNAAHGVPAAKQGQ
jgi:cell division protein FtsQ